MTWQPINTAPKDGTEILIWDGKHIDIGHWFSSTQTWYGRLAEDRVIATHWLPTPEPPS